MPFANGVSFHMDCNIYRVVQKGWKHLFPLPSKTVHGVCLISRIHMLCFMEISLACAYVLRVSLYCSQIINKVPIYFSPVHSFVHNLTMWHRFWALCKPGRRHEAKPFWIIWHGADSAAQVQDHNLVCVERLSYPFRKFTRNLEAESWRSKIWESLAKHCSQHRKSISATRHAL